MARNIPMTHSLRTASIAVFLATTIGSMLNPSETAVAQSGASRLPTVYDGERLLWSLELGEHQYTVPRIDRDRLFIGTDDSALEHPAARSTGGGILMCLDPTTGGTIWQLPIPRNMGGKKPPFHFNHWKCGVCSRPAVEGDRVYIVGPRGDLLCLDRNGQADGNAGPFLDEKAYMGIAPNVEYELSEKDGDIVWHYDMIERLGVVPHDVCGSSPAIHGNFLYACTSNGMDHTHRNIANPKAPSLVAIDKRTGELAAVDGANIGERILHGLWSSPVVSEFGGQQLVLFGGGDGVLYAFKALKSSDDRSVRTLDLAWKYDCCPQDYRIRNGRPIPYARWNQNRPDGPSEVIATPTVDNGRIYLTIGQSPVHGAGQGVLSCIDGASGRRVWESRDVGRTLSDATVHEGLVYVADYSGHLHCFDATTGDRYWHQDLIGGVWCATPTVVQDRVYIANEKNRIWVLRAGRTKQVLSSGRTRSMAITSVTADNLLLVPTQRRLFALRVAN